MKWAVDLIRGLDVFFFFWVMEVTGKKPEREPRRFSRHTGIDALSSLGFHERIVSIGTPVGAHHTKATSATYYVPSFFALLPGLPLREYRQCCPGFFWKSINIL